MKIIRIVNPYFRFLVIPVLSVLLFVVYWAINSEDYTQLYYQTYGVKGIAIDLLTIIFFSMWISESILLISAWIDKKWAWEQHVYWRILVQFLIEIPIVYIILKISEKVSFWTSPTSELDNRQTFVLGIIFSVVVTLFVLVDYFFKKMQLSIQEKNAYQNEFLKSQLHALRIQLDPHFLFNNFSTLQSLIDINPVLASEFLNKLSDVYRYLTEHRDENFVTVQKELDFVRAYVYLYQIRFGENFKVEISQIHSSQNQWIAPVTLQILIENAVKHNIISSEFPLKIQINVDQDHVVVTNTLQPKKSEVASLKSGLANIISRYTLAGKTPPEVIKTDTQFTVKIPLLSSLSEK